MEPLRHPKIWEIAAALRLPCSDAPADAILSFCDIRIEKVLEDFPDCANPAELLDIMAATLGTLFEEVHLSHSQARGRPANCSASTCTRQIPGRTSSGGRQPMSGITGNGG